MIRWKLLLVFYSRRAIDIASRFAIPPPSVYVELGLPPGGLLGGTVILPPVDCALEDCLPVRLDAHCAASSIVPQSPAIPCGVIASTRPPPATRPGGRWPALEVKPTEAPLWTGGPTAGFVRALLLT